MQKKQLENILKRTKMKYIIFYLFIIFNICSLQANTEDDTLGFSIDIKNNSQIRTIDTSFIYDLLIVHEGDSIFSDLNYLENLHFKTFIYYGNKRKNFPITHRKVSELVDIQLLGSNIETIPYFIDSLKIESITVESKCFHLNKQFLNFKNLKSLILNCFNNSNDKQIVCQLSNIEELMFYTKTPFCFEKDDCLFRLKNIRTIGLNINTDCIESLSRFTNLKKIYFYSKLKYFDVVKNQSLFKKMERINLSYKTNNKERKKINKNYPNFW